MNHETMLKRLANILQLSTVSFKEVWEAVRKERAKYNENDCPYRGQFDEVESQVQAIEELLKVSSSDIIWNNLTESTLRGAGEMFIYLNSCSHVLEPWVLFYKNLFQKESLDTITLTLNRILKNGNNQQNKNKNLQNIALTLFNRINSLFSFKYQEIQSLINGNRNLSWSLERYTGMLIFFIMLSINFNHQL